MTDTALHDLTLAEAAALIRTRKLSPVEYTRALLARTDALEPQLNAYITRTSEAAMEAARAAEAEIARAQLARPPARHPLRGEGHLRHGRRSDLGTFAHLHRSRAGQGRDRRGKAARSRCGADGQARHPRVRPRRSVLRPALAAGAQSLEHGALHRRLVVGIGGGDRGRPRAGEPGVRYRRLDPRPGWPVRHRRAQADLRPRQPRRRAAELLLLRSLRADGADVARTAR